MARHGPKQAGVKIRERGAEHGSRHAQAVKFRRAKNRNDAGVRRCGQDALTLLDRRFALTLPRNTAAAEHHTEHQVVAIDMLRSPRCAARPDDGGCQPETRQAVKTSFEFKWLIADRFDIVFEDGAAVEVANRRDAVALRQIARRNPHHLVEPGSTESIQYSWEPAVWRISEGVAPYCRRKARLK